MNTPTIYVRLSCLLGDSDRADDEGPWADNDPINPECEDDQQEN